MQTAPGQSPASPRAPGLRLSFLHALNFLGIGLYLPFFPIWLGSKGVGDVAIGYILALPILVRMLAASWVTGLADRHIAPVRLLSLLNALAACLYLVLGGLDSLPAIALLTGLSALVLSGVVPLADLLTTSQIRAGARVDYGRVRLWGSVSFALANLAGGYLLARHGAALVPFVLAGCSALAAFVALFAPAPPENLRPAGTGTATATRFPVAFWLAVAAAACVTASHAAIYGFGSLHWRTQGFSDSAIGFLWSIGVVAEIGIFFLAGGIVARGAAGLALVAFGAAVAALRFGLMSLDPGFWATAALQLLHGITFGCAHLGAMAAITALAPDGRRAAAQGRFAAAGALGSGALTVLAGYLYGRAGSGVFLAMVPVAVLGLVLAVLAIARRRGDTGRG